MSYTEILNTIPDSYFGKTMGRKLEIGKKPLINMAVGIPDKPAPDEVITAMQQAVADPANNKYGVFRGKETFKTAIQQFYKETYNVDLDKDEEICILYGTKNGLVHLPLCTIEPGDGVLLPDPGYTDYLAGVLLARGEHYTLPLYEEKGYLPDFDDVPAEKLDNTKLIYLNYPSNPTGAVATRAFFDATVDRFKETKTRIVHDFAYAAFGFNHENPSILQSPGAKEVAVEIYSLSKGFNMSGFRVGFAVGNKEMIAGLNKLQDHTQVGMWGALQDASTAALKLGQPFLDEQNELFRARRDKVVAVLKENNIPFSPLDGGIFLWLKTPQGYDGESFVTYLLKEQSVLVTPGIPFGERGRHYVRVSLAVDDSLLDAFLERLLEVYLNK
ncbi:aminotransferase class I/II-fold pyridoxal phosphate-dependent enzyme [Macrococcus hajekii]|uniref:Aminotransferase n=1 Tax=Macrococcus hajekii TaxID=198482 RepID=A0A4R6BJQ7_9STAP|nr:aminotransferase class I/II-fold pyridoxal phosphate-dependent enzyme [Macrococcus hajekii]TDM01860.1 aminotransferase class I/II-fold pyridoxal phosphate-dependent enzyme [Macrococcus hajekii]GGB08102.1 aminotransferase [Macrococcus hajekii]